MKWSTGALIALLITGTSPAQMLSGDALVKALRSGGYVIVMRHASSPRDVPANTERQLDAAGQAAATAMGKALRDLKIPIGEVLTSPTLRARQTAQFAQLPNPRPVPELGDNGQSMQITPESQAVRLKKRVTEFSKGTNAVAITHMPNLAAAFPEIKEIGDGEALVFGPDGKGGSTLVARIKIEQWPDLRY
jgi:phosphohistidine phosphatase SixA